ncbi:MAG: DegT/DnrJ/EryC1/StrS family aminotransferase [Gammaproteobacteria bacterium]|nr:DegT/DnrJ/EryC1/StrS family aminotransferase [Gammaproteobacteria bacterium]
MQFIDLEAQQKLIRADVDRRIAAVLDHGKYIMGPEVAELEEVLAEYVGSEHAISCSSGTDALVMPLMARGFGPGDIVITSPFTFMASAEVISLLGATPVFVDIDPVTYNMDPDALEKAIEAIQKGDRSIYPLPENLDFENSRLAAVIAVDMFGLPADYPRIEAICKAHDLLLIEDAAQSFGGAIGDARSCSFGHVATTSFFPAKPFGCYGDGGMIFTNDADLADVMRSIRVHGKGEDKYDNKRIGLNARLDTLQAAILLAKWELFGDEVDARQRIADRYASLLASEVPAVTPPATPEGFSSAWAQYTIRCGGRRADYQAALSDAGIPSAVYYPSPLHLQTAYAQLGYVKGSLAASEEASADVLSLPFGPYLRDEDMDKVVACLARV